MPLPPDITAAELLDKCRESALRLLDSRLHSRSELDRKLRERGFPAIARRAILADLERLGLVDDRIFAEAFVRDRLGAGRPVGSQRILLDLRRRGVPEDTARQALDEVAEEKPEDDELARARQAAETKWKSLVRSGREYQKARASLYRFLAGRGFDSQVIRRVADELPHKDRP